PRFPISLDYEKPMTLICSCPTKRSRKPPSTWPKPAAVTITTGCCKPFSRPLLGYSQSSVIPMGVRVAETRRDLAFPRFLLLWLLAVEVSYLLFNPLLPLILCVEGLAFGCARFLGYSQSSVTRWVSAKRRPGGTLRFISHVVWRLFPANLA